MIDVNHEKYARLMAEIENLEDELAVYEQRDGVSSEIVDEEELKDDLRILKEKLAEKRNELKRLSDGCGTPH